MSWIIQALIASYKSITSFPLSGLVSYWKLDESSWNFSDGTWGNVGIPTSVTSVSWKIGNASSLSWGTSYISMTNTLWTLWDNPYTISMWVKPITRDTTNWDLLLWAGNRNQQHIIASDWKLTLTTYDGTANNVIGNTVLSNGNWYHVVFQRTSSSAGKIYVNGSDDTSATASMRAVASTLAHEFRLGSRQDYTASNFNWVIDEVWIWNRALSASEITALYNAGNWAQLPSSSSIYIYAYGWYSGSYQSINDRFDNLSNAWTSKTAMTLWKRGMGCFSLWQYAYSAWGSTGSMSTTNYEYSQSGNSWTTRAAVTTWKCNATAGSLWSDKGYFIAGSDTVSNLSTNYEYSQSGNAWATKTASTQVARWLWNGTNIGTDKIYQSCGYISAPSNIHLEYSQSGNAWTSKTNRSESRYDWCFWTVIGSNFAYYNAGYTGSAFSTVNAQYSQSGNSWASKTAFPVNDYWAASTPVDTDKVSVMWGWDWGTTYYNYNYHYSESGNSWATRTTLWTSRADFQGATI